MVYPTAKELILGLMAINILVSLKREKDMEKELLVL
jgi:hypothetical protein